MIFFSREVQGAHERRGKVAGGAEAGVVHLHARSVFFLGLYVSAVSFLALRWGQWYLPHRGIVKVRNETCKIHIVHSHLNEGKL